MNRSHIVTLLALVAAVPAAALSARSLLPAGDTPCFSAGRIGYRFTARDRADYTVRIDNAAARPDLILQVVDEPAIADFVLADGSDDPEQCKSTQAIRTIRVDAQAGEPDLTIALSETPATGRYRIFARSTEFSREAAAALFAVMTQSGRKATALRRPTPNGNDVTGALTSPSPRSHRAAQQ